MPIFFQPILIKLPAPHLLVADRTLYAGAVFALVLGAGVLRVGDNLAFGVDWLEVVEC